MSFVKIFKSLLAHPDNAISTDITNFIQELDVEGMQYKVTYITNQRYLITIVEY